MMVEIDVEGNAWVYLGEVDHLLYGIPVTKCLARQLCWDCKKYGYWAPEELIMPIYNAQDPHGHDIVARNIAKHKARDEYMKGFEKYYNETTSKNETIEPVK